MEYLERRWVAGQTVAGKKRVFVCLFLMIYPPGRVAKVVLLSDFCVLHWALSYTIFWISLFCVNLSLAV